MEPILDTEDLNVYFGKTRVLWDVSFRIPQGVMVAILGPNGAGKSTLLKAILGLLPITSGKINLFGSESKKGLSRIAYMPQRDAIDWNFPLTAEELVLMGRYGRLGLFGRVRQADKEAARRALDWVGMLPYAKKQIGEFSGGQQQRLFMARALVQGADLLLLDEPFAAIDHGTEKEMAAILNKLKQEGKTILVVHHDLPTVEQYFDWALLLNHRLIGCGPLSEVFERDHLSRLFGKEQVLFEEVSRRAEKQSRGVL